MRRFAQHAFPMIFGTVYLGLMTSLLVVVVTLPAVAVLLATDLAVTWPVLALLCPLVAPALSAAFAVFAAHERDGSADVVRTFFSAWWKGLGRSLAIGGVATLVVAAFAADIAFFWGHRAGAVVIPPLATGIVVALAVFPMVLVVRQECPQAGIRDVVKAAVFVVVRRWYLTAVSLAALGVLAALVVRAPALGLGIALAPALYVVRANCHRSLVGVAHAAHAASGPLPPEPGVPVVDVH
ncbi:hypothetical protein GCM10009785_11440 [Brooklawnia cerclae]|uniref:Membrane protein YesL n=1 Tax=Brooklawnia cerclae TaxID=349934 RepID=A0ABX0SMS8_9ACTN|nr:DUF624 domain-containing protein [Brooklawnia cerclae]NIH58628.1 putative membrane protein YesL [Brooklawnia cerclae]